MLRKKDVYPVTLTQQATTTYALTRDARSRTSFFSESGTNSDQRQDDLHDEPEGHTAERQDLEHERFDQATSRGLPALPCCGMQVVEGRLIVGCPRELVHCDTVVSARGHRVVGSWEELCEFQVDPTGAFFSALGPRTWMFEYGIFVVVVIGRCCLRRNERWSRSLRHSLFLSSSS